MGLNFSEDLFLFWSFLEEIWGTRHRPSYFLEKFLSEALLMQPRPDEFGMRQRSGEYFAPNPILSFFWYGFCSQIWR